MGAPHAKDHVVAATSILVVRDVQHVASRLAVAAAGLSLATGWTTGVSPALAAAAVLLWNAAIYLDSPALTAGIVQALDKHLRGATVGLHSMAGYAGGFLGPLGVGWFLDLAGGDGVLAWKLAFGHLAAVTLAGLVVLRRLGRATPRARRTKASRRRWSGAYARWPPAVRAGAGRRPIRS